MNIQEYISSGIVESYVLGLADPAERVEFERMCDAHPEVRAARETFEISLEEHALANQIAPPAHMKSRIFSTIGMDEETYQRVSGSGIPPTSVPVDGTIDRGNYTDGRSKARVVNMQTGWQRFVAIAAVALLVLSTALNFYFFNRYQETRREFQALVQSQSELALNNQVLQTRLVDYERAVEMMQDPGMAIVKMPAIPTAPDPTSATTVYWDTSTKDVYLTINKLPAPAAGQQYQLWALVDGKPVDAGVFDIKEGPGLVKMKNIPKAQAFAITLEKKGGSPAPTMTQLYVMGKV